MAHYDIEIRGHPPIDWEMLRRQRDRINGMLSTLHYLSSNDNRALTGIRNLVDAMLDTHGRGKELVCPECEQRLPQD